MENPFIATIIPFSGNFAPRGWALCDGQLLAISQNDALFSILGTIYGGDGRTTFALPDLRGRSAIHAGSGNGLSTVKLGDRLGNEINTITSNQMPSHKHNASSVVNSVSISVNSATGEENTPVGQHLAGGTNIYSDEVGANQFLGGVSATGTTTLNTNGGSQPVNNRQPSLGINYIIALQGIYPSRS